MSHKALDPQSSDLCSDCLFQRANYSVLSPPPLQSRRGQALDDVLSTNVVTASNGNREDEERQRTFNVDFFSCLRGIGGCQAPVQMIGRIFALFCEG